MSAFSGLSLVCHCLPTCVPVLDGPPSRSLVFHCLPLSPSICVPVLDGASAFPRSCLPLSPIFSSHVCLCWMVPLPWMVCPPSRGLVSPCLPVLDGVSAFPTFCFPLSPHMCARVGWFVRLPKVFSPLAPLSSQLYPKCLPLSPFLSPRLPLSPVARHCFPLSPHMCACAGWCVRLLRSCLPLSPIVSQHVCLCWMVCPPSRGFVSLVSELVSQLVFLLVSQLVSQLVFLLFPFVAGGLILHFCPNSVRLGILNAFSCHVFDPVPQKHVLNPPTVWGLRWCNLVTASGFVSRNFPLVVLAGGWLSSRIRRTRFAAVSALISQH